MLVKNVMKRNVVSLRPEDTLEKAIKELVEHKISGAPVVDRGNRVIGLVTESDIIRTIDAYDPKIHFDVDTSFAVIYTILEHKREFEAICEDIIGSKKIHVKDFMEKKVVTIGPDEKIETAAKLINKHKVKRLPVVEDGRLIGIISRADIIMALAK